MQFYWLALISPIGRSEVKQASNFLIDEPNFKGIITASLI